jgi:hypothetical protein
VLVLRPRIGSTRHKVLENEDDLLPFGSTCVIHAVQQNHSREATTYWTNPQVNPVIKYRLRVCAKINWCFRSLLYHRSFRAQFQMSDPRVRLRNARSIKKKYSVSNSLSGLQIEAVSIAIPISIWRPKKLKFHKSRRPSPFRGLC